MKKGKITQIIGPVIDVEFEENEKLPEIYNALTIEKKGGGKLMVEVVKHLEPGKVRAIALETTDGLARGTEVVDTGKQIEVPVGSRVLGHIFDVTGKPLDVSPEKFFAKGGKFYPIHRNAPLLTEQSTKNGNF